VLVKFTSKQGNITMFGSVAVTLLRMMGQSGVVPGALLGKDVAAALERLKRAVAAHAEAPPPAGGNGTDEDEVKVSLRQRAFPLIELLTRAAAKECDVIWEEERPAAR